MAEPRATPPTVSVVILTANRCDLLMRALASLAVQSRRPTEVIVVDNGSQDGTRATVAAGEWPFPVRLVDGPGRSYAEARNHGVAAGSGEWVLFLDDDCEADEPMLARLLATAVANGWRAVGGIVLPADELEAPNGFTPGMNWAVGLAVPGMLGPLAGRRHLPAACCLMAQRTLLGEFPFQEIGGQFGSDGESYTAGREDAEWWRRLRRAAVPVGMAHRAVAWHHVPQSRMEMDYIRARAEADGEAAWQREGNEPMALAAAADVAHAPLGLAAALVAGVPPDEAWAETRLWVARQWSLLRAAVDDRSVAFDPEARAAALLKAGARAAGAAAKATVRPAVVALFQTAAPHRAMPSVGEPPRRLLVVLHDLLGDAVLALPLLGQLAAAFPDARIDVLTGPVAAPLLAANVAGNVVVEQVAPGERSASPRAVAALYRRLAARDYDAAVVAYCHGLCPAAVFLLGCPVVGWREDNGLVAKVWGDLLSHPVEKNFRKAEVAALLDLAGPFGVLTRLERPIVAPSERAAKRIRRVMASAGVEPGRAVVVHFEGEARSKFWPVERMSELVRRLVGAGHRVLLVGGRAGRHAAEALPEGVVVLNGLLDSDELAGLLAAARLFVGPDSGPGHVAQAVGCRALLLFGATEGCRWGPVAVAGGAPAVVLSRAPGDWLEEETAGLPIDEALRRLPLEDVWERVSSLLTVE